MRRILIIPALLLLMLALTPTAALAQGDAVEVSSADLLEQWDEYNGREVIYRGEAVGDVMVRGDYAWITVNDDHYSLEALKEAGKLRGGNSGIGIWLPADEAERIHVLGRYGTVGDYVEVRGVFHSDCVEHGGDFDIHAYSLTVVDPGHEVNTSPSYWRYAAAAGALLFLLLTLTPFLRRKTMEMRSARALMREEE